MPVKVAEERLSICGGCECSILDLGEAIFDLLPKLEFVHFPILMDHKYYGQTGEGEKLEIPDADVGLISGGIRTEEHKEIAKEMRKKCKTVIAFGSCACFGGIPALANLFVKGEVFDKVFKSTKSTEPGEYPSVNIPPWTDRVYALDEVIKVDTSLPGCPPPPNLIAEAITAAVENKPFKLKEKPVCEDCPRRPGLRVLLRFLRRLLLRSLLKSLLKREIKATAEVKRPLGPVEEGRCFLSELGYLCLGHVTRAGCRGKEDVPRCTAAGFPCRGCFGPVRAGQDMMKEMMDALVIVGLNVRTIPDYVATFNRYVGAHNRLQPHKVR